MIGINYLGERAETVLEIAAAQGKSTGLTHGPSALIDRFTGLLHATGVGQRMIEVVRGE